MRFITRIKKTQKAARRGIRAFRRSFNRRRIAATLVVTAFAAACIIPAMHHEHTIDPTAYQPLLAVIAKGESKGNYNAYFAHASNTDIKFTDMTIAQVLAWQDDFIRQGSPSSAVGKYQIVRSTLRGLVKQLDIDTTQRFDPTMQDRLARALIDRRGAKEFSEKRITTEQFATNLSKEWASLPTLQEPHPEQSYYAGDGLNAARVSGTEIRNAITNFQARSKKS